MIDDSKGMYVETNYYLREMDNGEWMEAVVDFYWKDGKVTGYVEDVMVLKERPEFSKDACIYQEPIN
ncbi:hypothetical protein [Candidatus Igneacidithiobacillus taiwanensis]|uniref:hypothetical protein n=1 Tax=Candidatus Igneacidithiobacillus taiwanensis TaxID=1945924 RepID=UPI0028A1A3AF|nr:hypothetical protein [Candidatus Igneacidithiobacillus taiwanensis]